MKILFLGLFLFLSACASPKVAKERPFLIGVADSGVELSHPMLKGRISVPNVADQVLLKNKSDILDNNGHGTHVTGIIVQNLPKSMNYKIVPFKNIHGSDEKEEECLDDLGISLIVDQAIKRGIKILNFSQTMGEYKDSAYKALKKANDHGIIIVAASGNKALTGGNHVYALDLTSLKRSYEVAKKKEPSIPRLNAYPCAYDLPNVICVGNYMKVGVLSNIRVPDSNYGQDTVHMMAYGEEVSSSCLGGTECKMSGSSMSTPRVTAELAKIWKKNLKLKPQEVISTLLKKLPKDEKLKNLTVTGAFLD